MKTVRFVFAAALVALAPLAAAQAPFAFDQVYDSLSATEGIHEVAISPDGAHVAWVQNGHLRGRPGLRRFAPPRRRSRHRVGARLPPSRVPLRQRRRAASSISTSCPFPVASRRRSHRSRVISPVRFGPRTARPSPSCSPRTRLGPPVRWGPPHLSPASLARASTTSASRSSMSKPEPSVRCPRPIYTSTSTTGLPTAKPSPPPRARVPATTTGTSPSSTPSTPRAERPRQFSSPRSRSPLPAGRPTAAASLTSAA